MNACFPLPAAGAVFTVSSRTLRRFCLVGAFVFLNVAHATAQPETASSPPEPVVVPEQEEIDLETKDGVALKATYYPGTHGRDSAVLVMLHMYQGSRADYHRFAKRVQSEFGFAVLAPDLRGHGDSIHRAGARLALSPERLRTADVDAMTNFDMEAVRKFLLAQHNEETLNLNRLCLIGSEMGSVVAMQYAALDFSWPTLPTVQQNKFVRALVLISPEFNFRGVAIHDALKSPALSNELAILLICGAEDSTVAKNARRIYQQIEGKRPGERDVDDVSQRTLFQSEEPTRLQGTKLLAEMPDVESLIVDFINIQVVSKSIPWVSLKRPNQ